jgi:hypothetical protein
MKAMEGKSEHFLTILIPQDNFFHSLSAEQYPTILSLTRFMSVDMNKH